ncbi:macrodontain-1-like [Durio zibethinus]|uniref:Macrodontain-1-like n=1 Tax=Durio zibethinus TaxID=66656 RepID=A0A6P5ZH55_DURZI|nr:macrodontain-1-like [Durio zibethinus]
MGLCSLFLNSARRNILELNDTVMDAGDEPGQLLLSSKTSLPPIRIPPDYPQRVDWREKKGADQVLNPVRNQKACQACWALVTVVVLESVRKIRFEQEELKLLSPQMLIDCVCEDPPADKIDTKTGCYPYAVNKAFDWLIKNSVQSEADYPYVATRGKCLHVAVPKESLKIKKYVKIKGHERTRLLKHVARHPLAAVIEITKEILTLNDQVYEGLAMKPQEDPPRHAVVIIGYGKDEETGKNYWLIQSSWGDEWAIGGVGKVARDVKANVEMRGLFP